MTDRVCGFLVTLAVDIRTDDVESIRLAIEQIKGVLSAENIPSNFEAHIAKQRALYEIRDKLWNCLREMEG